MPVDSKTIAQVKLSIASASNFGFKRESSFRRWAYLMYLTDGEIKDRADISEFIKTGAVPAEVSRSGTPIPSSLDERMKQAM
jgi:hypothetical protein